MSSPAVTYPELSNFDQEFQPTAGRRSNLDSLTDGDYDFEILDANLARTPQTNELILKVGLRVTSEGPAKGQTIEHPYFFRTPQKVAYLGGDLCTLGFDADKWKPEHGRKFSDELPKAVARLAGLRFRGRKKAEEGNDGKTYHNLFINARLAGDPMPPPAEEANGHTDSVPF